MGRLPSLDRSKLVSYDKDRNASRCLLCDKLLSTHSGNIKRHYEKLHKYSFAGSKIVPDQNSESGAKKILTNLEFQLNKTEFLRCCVGLVTLKDIPLRLFDEEYFREIVKPYQKEFNLYLNSENILKHIETSANSVRNILKQSFNDEMLSLKLDVVIQKDKSVLVMNVQYISDFEILTNTIGVIQLTQEHTSIRLKNEIVKCLEEFDICLEQISAIVMDNAANVGEICSFTKDDVQDLLNHTFDVMPQNENHDYDSIYDRLKSYFTLTRCVAYTVQLAAQEVCAMLQNELESCRQVVTALRVNMQNSFLPTSLPKIDNVNQWISTYEMMVSLVNLKDEINGKDAMFFVDQKIDWNFVENFVNVFAPLMECQKQLQTDQYIVGDFYRDWLMCEAKLKRMDYNALAIVLLNSMGEQKQKLLEDINIICAIYFDPRFNFLDSPFLSDSQRRDAVEHIMKTNTKVSTLCGERKLQVQNSDPYDILEEELYSLASSSKKSKNVATIQQKIKNLARGQRMAFGTNVLEYWKDIFVKDEDLYKMAEVNLAVPTSQCTMERAFRALSTTLNKQYAKLSNEAISDFVLIKLNEDLFDN